MANVAVFFCSPSKLKQNLCRKRENNEIEVALEQIRDRNQYAAVGKYWELVILGSSQISWKGLLLEGNEHFRSSSVVEFVRSLVSAKVA